jgi:hypothetical protein
MTRFEEFSASIVNLFLNPALVSIICMIFILLYYLLSAGFIYYKDNITSKWWKRNGIFDILTSVLWTSTSLLLILSLLFLEIKSADQLTLGFVVVYYLLFVFLFAFLYGIIDWHKPGTFADLSENPWHKELQYVIISFQTQSTLGYTRAKPNHLLPELVTCLQVFLGLFFIVTSVSKSIG